MEFHPEISEENLMQPAQLSIPSHLKYDSGEFAHQGQAIRAWEAADSRGILEMATGSGKTITAMVCATRLQNKLNGLIVVVSAPYKPLIEQWCAGDTAIRRGTGQPYRRWRPTRPRERNWPSRTASP